MPSTRTPSKSSPARIAANRRDSARSTGPRTATGRQAVRLNALQHGLRAETPVLPCEDQEALENRKQAWIEALKPADAVQLHLVEVAVTASWAHERVLKAEAQLAEAAAWASMEMCGPHTYEELAERPVATLARLHSSPEGTRWLIEQWTMVHHALRPDSTWDEAHTRLLHALEGGGSLARVGDDPGARLRLVLSLFAGWAGQRDEPGAWEGVPFLLRASVRHTGASPNSARLVRVSCLECVFRVHASVVPPV
jgi:hypothetical protein